MKYRFTWFFRYVRPGKPKALLTGFKARYPPLAQGQGDDGGSGLRFNDINPKTTYRTLYSQMDHSGSIPSRSTTRLMEFQKRL